MDLHAKETDSRVEKGLSTILGNYDKPLPKPQSRVEEYLKEIIEEGGSGGGGGDGYTKAQIDALLAGKSDSNHNHNDAYYTKSEVDTTVQNLEANFQDGVDDVYDAVVAKGSTPASKSLSDVVAGIAAIPTGGTPVIEHSNNWSIMDVKGVFKTFDDKATNVENLWTDGSNLYIGDDKSKLIFDESNLEFIDATYNYDSGAESFNGSIVINIDNDVYLNQKNSCQWKWDKNNSLFHRSSTPYTGDTTYYPCFWTDGIHWYYSENNYQYVRDDVTGLWLNKTWNYDGISTSGFYGYNIWTDGTNIYQSDGTYTWVLDVPTSTWSLKTWNGYNAIYGRNIWTDGTDIYYSIGTVHKVLDKATSTWSNKTWTGMTNFDGYWIWNDSNGDTYYTRKSAPTGYKVLDKATSTWSNKTWTASDGNTALPLGFTKEMTIEHKGSRYLLYNSKLYVLDVTNSTWTYITDDKPIRSLKGYCIWSDGDHIQYSESRNHFIFDPTINKWKIKASTNFEATKLTVWTDGTNIYNSSSSGQYILDKSDMSWVPKTWNGLSGFYGKDIWTDGTNIYYSSGTSQYILDVSTSTWSRKTWNLNSFYGMNVKNINGEIYCGLKNGGHTYKLDVSNSSWVDIGEWCPVDLKNTFEFNGTYYASDKTTGLCYRYNSIADEWVSIDILRPYYLESASDVWTDGLNVYYSHYNDQFVFDKVNLIWRIKQWNYQPSELYGRFIWSDGENIYYSVSNTTIDSITINGIQKILDKSTSTWGDITWTGNNRPLRTNIFDDGSHIFILDNSSSHKMYKLDPPSN